MRDLFAGRLPRSRAGRYTLALILLACAAMLMMAEAPPARGQDGGSRNSELAALSISGSLLTSQGQPIHGAEVRAFLEGHTEGETGEAPLALDESQADGTWTLEFSALPIGGNLLIEFERHHFAPQTVEVPLAEEVLAAATTRTLTLGEITLARRTTLGFWVAAATFTLVIALIALEKLHSTTAALVGVSILFAVTSIGGKFVPDMYIMDFETALEYINWEVIFLVMGMMIVITIIEGTGVFQWMAFNAYRLSRGRTGLLVLILMAITAVASALLDNFTTMLLMTPISVQIALALGINPCALIIPEVMASNVGGISTLIGTPTNIMIGAHAGISFNGFLINQTLGVLAALAAMAVYVLWHYRAEFSKVSGGISQTLYNKLEENAKITKPAQLQKSLLVFGVTLAFFVIGEDLHMDPAVTALIGATAMLLWVEPDVDKMVRAVDWTTLVFFMALFMVVGAVTEVGLISYVADAMGTIVGESMILGIVVIMMGVGLISTFIADIPLVVAMLPVVDFLSGSVPGASSGAFYYALSMGAAMGGNGMLIGAEANLVTAGIMERAGYPLSFKAFLQIGMPVTILTLVIGTVWLVIRFGV